MSSSSSSEITRMYLLRLLEEVLPLQAGESYVNSVFNDIYNTVVISRLKGNQSVRPEQVLQKYEPVILMSENSRNNLKVFQDLVENLYNLKTEDQIANYLMFLDSTKNRPTTTPSSSAFGTPRSRTHQQHLNQQQQENIRYLSMDHHNLSHRHNPFIEPMLQDQTNFRSASFTIGGKTMNQIIQPYYYEHQGTLTDDEILQFLSYTLLGSPSKLFPFVDNGMIQLPRNINPSIEGFLLLLLEPAVLYRHLVGKFESMKYQPSLSQIKVAFVSELSNKILTGYLKLVNELFDHTDLTLRKVYLAINDEIIKLRFLNYLTSLLEIKGSEFVSKLFEFTEHGDLLIRSVACQLFEKAILPYHNFVLEWITDGEISNDIEGEFFVKYDDSKYEKNLEDYVFLPDRIPSFFTAEISDQIYQIGKSIVFLKYYCKELKWLHETNLKYKKLIVDVHGGFGNMSKSTLSSLIQTEYKEVINFACSKIYNNYHVIDDIKGINDLLMRKGDLTYAIIEKGYTMLNEPSVSLTSHKLNRLLNEAIEDSSMKHNSYKDIVNKIDARVLNHGNIGFESFTLDYHASLPLIFEDSMKEYLRLFNFFFKVKRVSYMLNYSWKESISLKEINSYVKKLKIASKRKKDDSDELSVSDYIYAMNHIKKLNIVSSNMTKFVNNVLMFFNYEIIEKNYKELIRKFETKDEQVTTITKDSNGKKKLARLAPNAEFLQSMEQLKSSNTTSLIPNLQLIDNGYKDFNIDSIIEYHQIYVKNISRNRLLDTKAASSKGRLSDLFFIHQLNNLLAIVYRFLMVNEEFYLSVLELLNTLNTPRPDPHYVASLKSKLELLNDNLYEILYKFKGSLDVFTNDLINDDDPQLKFFAKILYGQ